MELARHAQEIGADGILAITPYFWTPTLEAIEAYFVRLCTSIDLPVLSYNSPSYLAGVEITGDLMARLIERLPNFVGVKEASFNSEKFLEISRAALRLRPNFAMLTGVEFLLPSVPLGGVGSYSAAGSICPNLCTELFDSCMAGEWDRARELQYKMTRLWHLFKDQYPSSLKGGMVIMGRPVGPTRAPLPTATPERQAYIRAQLEDLGILDDRAARLVIPKSDRSTMPFEPGLVHTPVTPFSRDGTASTSISTATLIDFHLRNGADALAVPMHAGESVSLPDAERRALIEFAIKRARGRAPIIAHVSDAGTGIAAALARAAQAGRRRRHRRHHAVLLDAATSDGA